MFGRGTSVRLCGLAACSGFVVEGASMRSRKLMQVWRLLGVSAVAVAIASSASAQTLTGGLRGAVRDANGVVPGVAVELVNESTGISREAVSNDQGEYNFAAVQPGTYTVKASLTGFKTYE